ncbi:MAG TPA: ArsA-related P-loop ATPase [Methanomicrobiales archaeon]|nr:ArsA-related P-loop ATPase [Methanomicrobiales archaeon]
MVKIAVTGKGGVGKTTVAAGLARAFGSRGYRVTALDMDPSPNLARSLSCGPLTPRESPRSSRWRTSSSSGRERLPRGRAWSFG